MLDIIFSWFNLFRCSYIWLEVIFESASLRDLLCSFFIWSAIKRLRAISSTSYGFVFVLTFWWYHRPLHFLCRFINRLIILNLKLLITLIWIPFIFKLKVYSEFIRLTLWYVLCTILKSFCNLKFFFSLLSWVFGLFFVGVVRDLDVLGSISINVIVGVWLTFILIWNLYLYVFPLHILVTFFIIVFFVEEDAFIRLFTIFTTFVQEATSEALSHVFVYFHSVFAPWPSRSSTSLLASRSVGLWPPRPRFSWMHNFSGNHCFVAVFVLELFH